MKTTIPIVRPGPDPLSQPFWEAAAEHRLVLQRCGHCDRVNHPPQALCGHCGAAELTWTDSDGRGTVYSWTSVLQRPGAGRDGSDDPGDATPPTPDTVLVVAVGGDPDALLVGRIASHPDWIELGAPTQVVFRDLDSDDPGQGVVTVPDFVSAADDA